MDPKQCLIDADQALSDENYGYCLACLCDYAIWRDRGGFEPPDGLDVGGRGDKFYQDTIRRLRDQFSLMTKTLGELKVKF